MKKKHSFFFLLFVCLFVISVSASKEDTSKNWVKGVELVITDAEKTVFEYKHIFAFSPDSFEGKLIQQVESSGEDVIQIPFEQRVLFTKAGNLSSYLTFLFKIDPGIKIPDKLTVFGRLKSEGYSADIRREIKLFEENDYLFAQVGLPALPESGEYAFVIKITDEVNNNTASQRMAFIVL
jgi:hypothetical protein